MSNAWTNTQLPINETGEAIYKAVDGATKVLFDAANYFWREYGAPKFRGLTVRQNLEAFFLNKGMVIKGRNGEVREKPRIGKFIRTEYGYHIIVKLYPGLCLQNIKPYELGAALNAEVDAHVDTSGWVHFKVYTRRLPKVFRFREDLALAIRKYPCAIPVGISRRGFLILDLSRDEFFALLIGGQPGFGKSEFIRQALTAAVLAYEPSEVQFYLIDMKDGLELETFQYAPHTVDWSGDLRGSERVLRALQGELRQRAEMMKFVRVSNIKDYNRKVPKDKRLPHIILVVDEYASLDDTGKLMVQGLCQLARFAGIHPIVCTQRPSHKILPGDTKALMPVGLGFKVKNELNSKMILGDDHPQAAYLQGKGRAIFQTNRLHEVQVMALDKDTSEKMILAKYPERKEISTCVIEADVVSW